MTYHPGIKYPPNWNSIRYGTFERYGYICQLCFNFAKGRMQIHHIQPLGCGGAEADYNRIPLCFECHDYVHSGKYKGPLLKLR